jgi:flavin-binding protein dodecin
LKVVAVPILKNIFLLPLFITLFFYQDDIHLPQGLSLPWIKSHKIIEIIGSSDKGWEDAAQLAVDEAKKTLHGIHGIEVVDRTAAVDPTSGKLTNYRTCLKVSFAVD